MTRHSQGTMTRLLWGAAAGAAGTTALNAVTYGDMLLRARSASGVPAKVAGRLAGQLGVTPVAAGNDDESAKNRRSAAGALLGITTGVGIGVAYAAARTGSEPGHPVRDGVLLGLAAMAGSDLPTALTGTSDPRTWPASAWLTDLVPHLAYGFATAAAFNSRHGQ